MEEYKLKSLNYTITNDISKATAWLSDYDPDSVVKDYIIPNKIYKLFKLQDDLNDEESFIKSEDGYYSQYFICHNGDFIIMKEN